MLREIVLENLEKLEGTISFVEGFDCILKNHLAYEGIVFEKLSDEDYDQILSVIKECDCGVIKLTEEICENCGG